MPAIRVYGRKWHVSTDDMPMPAFVGVAWHGSWGAVVAVCLRYFVAQVGEDCRYRAQCAVFLSIHLGLFYAAFLLHLWLLVESCRGTHVRMAFPMKVSL